MPYNSIRNSILLIHSVTYRGFSRRFRQGASRTEDRITLKGDTGEHTVRSMDKKTREGSGRSQKLVWEKEPTASPMPGEYKARCTFSPAGVRRV